ncbi:LysR family transcriptional regulator [Georgenia sp. Z1491]|uniref:LysR family transcriptional regulator n=1 Tax=Georgenia sp. Z1491 TaxID=3416707 RepID=UPI003CE8C397
MELQQLRYVLAVAETRSFTRAAERCFVVQSALSHQVKALERELGVDLFARTSRRVEVTAAGEAFLPAARAALDAVERAAAEAASAAGEVRGTLRIGLIPTVTALDVPALVGRLRDEHPAVRVTMRGGGSDELVAAIRSGELDLAVLGLSDTRSPVGVASRELAREPLVAVLPAGHRLARRRRLGLAELADETFADFGAGTPGRAQSDIAFAAAGVAREVAFESIGPELLLGLVAEGLAVTLLPAAVVPDDARTVVVPVVDGPVRVEHLAWSDFNPGPATLAFLDLLDA